ncbi:MAG: hypothetical protein IKD97_05065 [Firmicutes bacterium]|nr:hypothetical protein [Bacillota bacterium]
MKNNPINLTLLGSALIFYLLYKVSGKPPLAFIAFLLVFAAGIHRLVYDIRHGTLPFTKARNARRQMWEHARRKNEEDQDN